VSSPRLDILHIVPTLEVGGAEQLLVDRVPLLRERGYAIAVCALGPEGTLGPEFRLQGVPVYTCGMRRGRDAPRGLFRLAHHLCALRPRIVHTHMIWSDLAAFLLSPVVRDARWLSSKHVEPSALVPHLRALDRLLTRRATRVVTVSAAVRQAYGPADVHSDRMRTVRHGAMDHGPAAGDMRAALRTEWKVPQHAVVIGTATRLARIKGVDVLLDAWRLLEREESEAYLVIAGDGPDAQALRARALTLHDPNRVRFLGLRRDMHRVYHAFDVFVLGSRLEAISLAVLEAMASGLPVVATKTGGIPEVVVDGRTGLLVPPEHPSALARALREVIADRSRRIAMGSAGRARYEAAFTVNRELADWIAIYRELGVKPRKPFEASSHASAGTLDAQRRAGYSRPAPDGACAGSFGGESAPT
jgi:glycosyltransferase involved in cell wall biosynthesis